MRHTPSDDGKDDECGNHGAGRDACLLDVRSLLGTAASAEIMDADSGEMVAVSA